MRVQMTISKDKQAQEGEKGWVGQGLGKFRNIFPLMKKPHRETTLIITDDKA